MFKFKLKLLILDFCGKIILILIGRFIIYKIRFFGKIKMRIRIEFILKFKFFLV